MIDWLVVALILSVVFSVGVWLIYDALDNVAHFLWKKYALFKHHRYCEKEKKKQ